MVMTFVHKSRIRKNTEDIKTKAFIVYYIKVIIIKKHLWERNRNPKSLVLSLNKKPNQ